MGKECPLGPGRIKPHLVSGGDRRYRDLYWPLAFRTTILVSRQAAPSRRLVGGGQLATGRLKAGPGEGNAEVPGRPVRRPPSGVPRGRRLLRIALALVALTFLWTRTSKQWHDLPALWLAGTIALSVILVLALVFEVSGLQQRWKRMRDEVPKKPLGLDA
jgi:hypothetical protein